MVWTLDGESIFDCMMKILLALAYPFCCMVVLYVVVLSCDDHQSNWWEQMGEVPAVNKEMVIPLLSHRGWILYFFPSWFSLGLWSMYCLRLATHFSFVDFIWCSLSIVVCPVCRDCIKDPKTTLHCYLCVTFPLILRFKLNKALQTGNLHIWQGVSVRLGIFQRLFLFWTFKWHSYILILEPLL